VRGETVRKSSEPSVTQPYGRPSTPLLGHLVFPMAAESIPGASLRHLFGQSRKGFSPKLSRKEAGGASSLPMQTCSAYYSCPGALNAVTPALRIISIASSALNSGVVLVALRCPRLAETNT
jgi:hypothetical protein